MGLSWICSESVNDFVHNRVVERFDSVMIVCTAAGWRLGDGVGGGASAGIRCHFG